MIDDIFKRDAEQTLYKPEIADFCVARVGGISTQVLNKFVIHRTLLLIDEALLIEASMQNLALYIEEYLYKLVPLLDNDKYLRRRILTMRRNIHNARLWPEVTEDIVRVTSIMDEGESQQFHAWYKIARERERILQEATCMYEQEVRNAAIALFACSKDQEFQQGLALASQDITNALIQCQTSYEEAEWKPSSKIARSVLAYLTRATIKTSPFSTFTQLCVVDFEAKSTDTQNKDLHDDRADIHQVDRAMWLAQSLPFTWLMYIARDPELAPVVPFEPNQGIGYSRSKEGYATILTTEYAYYGDFAARNERFVKRKFGQGKVDPLTHFLMSDSSFTYYEFLKFLEATGQFPNSHKTLIHLLDMQLIRPIAPYTKRDERPLLTLAAVLEQLPDERAHNISSLMRHAQILCDTIGACDAATRLENLASLRQKIALIFDQLAVTTPAWVQHASLVYEDVRFDTPQLTLHTEIQKDLSQVAYLLRPRIVRTKTYDHLYQFFLKNFGIEGEVDDIQGFLQQYLEQDLAGELTLRAMAEDTYAMNTAEEGRSNLSAGRSSTPPACTIFFQVAAENQDALARGDYKIIINQVHSGQGGLLSRFSRVLKQDSLTIKLRRWLQSLHGEKRVLEMPVVGDWHNLQSAQGMFEEVLQWPAELSTSDKEDSLRLRDLRLRVDSLDETLYLVDTAGQIVAPSYLGVVPSYFSPHILKLFLRLIDPWIDGWALDPFNVDENKLEQIKCIPRREEGRVVIQRASWIVPISQIPFCAKSEDNFTFFVRLQKWLKDYSIPEEVFASRREDNLSFDHKKRKPVWIHFGSPHTVELFYRLLDKDTLSVVLTEVLPTRNQHWVTSFSTSSETEVVSGERHEAVKKHASEFMSLVRWPMPTSFVSQPQALNMLADQPLGNQRTEWLYFKIYPLRLELLDAVICSIVVPACEEVRSCGALASWFYIRFYDESGWHIRLRLKVLASLSERLQTEIQTFIIKMLSQLSLSSSEVLEQEEIMALKAAPHVSIQLYEPEYEKYGGSTGVAIAERLFAASSELAVKYLMYNHSDLNNILFIAIVIMQDMLDVVYKDAQKRRYFLQYYLWYWTNQNQSDSAKMREELKQKALKEKYMHIKETIDLRNGGYIQEMLQEYKHAFAANVQLCTTLMMPHNYSIRQLCFDQMHLTNNRLGISTSHEGYLAALLLAFEEM